MMFISHILLHGINIDAENENSRLLHLGRNYFHHHHHVAIKEIQQFLQWCVCIIFFIKHIIQVKESKLCERDNVQHI
jgi:hypothetical protein